jgi:hypothetical protein
MSDHKALQFEIIKKINVEDPASWEDKVFLTFDVDWAHDDILTDIIDLVERYGVPVTWFVTHETPLNKRLRENPLFELGIHPNFNYLLQGDSRNGRDAREIVSRLMDIVPEAKSVRSHSLAFGTLIQGIFSDLGITHDCNHFVPEQSEVTGSHPFTLWDGMTRVPHFFCDYTRCIYDASSSIEQLLHRDSIKVFDFHPVHVFLNTEDLDLYETTRSLHSKPAELVEHRSRSSNGSRGLLKQLLADV